MTIFALIFPFILLVFSNCKDKKGNSDKINEIFKLSNIEIPKNSKLLKYYDNNEFQIVFEIEIQKKDLIKFIKKYKFEKFQPNAIKIAKTSSHSYIIKDIENSFVPPIQIIKNNQKILIYSNSNIQLILNCKKSILYGLVSY
ncbi:hypothetical protein [Flavobacterium sp.]